MIVKMKDLKVGQMVVDRDVLNDANVGVAASKVARLKREKDYFDEPGTRGMRDGIRLVFEHGGSIVLGEEFEIEVQ